jgi:hypothetical protein
VAEKRQNTHFWLKREQLKNDHTNMNPEIPHPEEKQITPITRERLVEHLSKMADTPEKLKWDVETKRMIHEWKIARLQSVPKDKESKVRLGINLALADICREAGLGEEEIMQYRNFFDVLTVQKKVNDKVKKDNI